MKITVLCCLVVLSLHCYSQVAYSQFADPTLNYQTTQSGSCACSFATASNVADNDLSNSARITIAASLGGASRGIRAKLNATVPGNTRAGFYINYGALVSLLPSVTLTTYKLGVLRETPVSGGSLATLLAGGQGYICFNTSAGLDYDEVGISFNSGITTVGTVIDVFYAFGGATGCPSTSLPVKLTGFSVSDENNSPLLYWAANDNGTTRYEIQQSKDGKTFITIHTENSSTGNGTKTFHYVDQQANASTLFYRIAVTDNNSGAVFYSKIISINLNPAKRNTLQVFPNPITGRKFSISFPGNAGENYTIQLIDKGGRIVFNKTIISSDNNGTLAIQLDRPLAAGIYMVKATGTGSFYKELVVVQ